MESCRKFLYFFLFLASFVLASQSAEAATTTTTPNNGCGNISATACFLQNSTQMDELIDSLDEGSFDINNLVNSAPVYSTVLPGSAFALACDFKRQFCGRLTLVIVTVAIFTIGILTLMQKIKPYYAILIVAMIIIMLNAPQLIALIMGYLEILPGVKAPLGWMATKTCWCTNFSF
jgi:type IV secretory pathway VirB2 component (pilin)